MEVSFEYWNKLASQSVLISALLSGFSMTVLVSIILYPAKNRFATYTLIAATIATGSFLVAIFAFTDILMMTTVGYPLKIVHSDLNFPRTVGALAWLLGIVSLCAFLSFLGWIKSKKLGMLTTTIGVVTFILIVLMLS